MDPPKLGILQETLPGGRLGGAFDMATDDLTPSTRACSFGAAAPPRLSRNRASARSAGGWAPRADETSPMEADTMERLKTMAIMALLAALAASIALATTGGEAEVRINARQLEDGRVEFGVEHDGDRLLPARRYFPASVDHARWLRSSPVTVDVVPNPPSGDVSALEARDCAYVYSQYASAQGHWRQETSAVRATYWLARMGSLEILAAMWDCPRRTSWGH